MTAASNLAPGALWCTRGPAGAHWELVRACCVPRAAAASTVGVCSARHSCCLWEELPVELPSLLWSSLEWSGCAWALSWAAQLGAAAQLPACPSVCPDGDTELSLAFLHLVLQGTLPWVCPGLQGQLGEASQQCRAPGRRLWGCASLLQVPSLGCAVRMFTSEPVWELISFPPSSVMALSERSPCLFSKHPVPVAEF